MLVGNTNPLEIKRSRTAAGHKAMWHPSWGGLPPEEFLVKLDPLLKEASAYLCNSLWTTFESKGADLVAEVINKERKD